MMSSHVVLSLQSLKLNNMLYLIPWKGKKIRYWNFVKNVHQTLISDPFLILVNNPKQPLHASNSFTNRIFWKRIIKKVLKSLFFFRTACHLYVTRVYMYVTRMPLVRTRMPSVCHSYVLVCHSYVLVCHPYVTCMYLYVLVCHPYVTRMSSVCHSYVVLPWTLLHWLWMLKLCIEVQFTKFMNIFFFLLLALSLSNGTNTRSKDVREEEVHIFAS